MSTVFACAYTEYDQADALATYYAQGAAWQLMADYLVGAAAVLNVRSPIPLAIGNLEDGGPGNNWLQMGSTSISEFQTKFWAQNNATGQPTPSSTQIQAIDPINAAAGVWWYQQGDDCNVTDWQGLLSRSSWYNGNCINEQSACACPTATAYGWTSLFLAYGNAYDTVDSMNYQGAYYVTSPTGLQYRYLSASCGSGTNITVPTFATTRILRSTPYGLNSTGRQIVLLAYDTIDTISSLQIDINQYDAGYYQPLVTSDADFAARSTQDSSICVIAVGGPAVTAINNACSSLGLSCESFSSFSAWDSTPAYGYINADGATAADSYSLGNTAADQASAAGW